MAGLRLPNPPALNAAAVPHSRCSGAGPWRCPSLFAARAMSDLGLAALCLSRPQFPDTLSEADHQLLEEGRALQATELKSLTTSFPRSGPRVPVLAWKTPRDYLSSPLTTTCQPGLKPSLLRSVFGNKAEAPSAGPS